MTETKLHGGLKIRNLSSHVQHSKRNFLSPRDFIISSILLNFFSIFRAVIYDRHIPTQTLIFTLSPNTRSFTNRR